MAKINTKNQKPVQHLSLLSLLITTLFSSFINAQTNTSEHLQSAADALLERYIQEEKFAGVTAGIAVAGSIQWVGNAGVCDADQELNCTDQTINRIASISKTMTAVAALQLLEQGQLSLDTPINTYLPDYPTEAGAKITPRMLLHHTSGIGGYASGKETETTEEFGSLRDACTVFQNRDLLFEPGTAYHYSTYGYVLLGAVIEAAANQTFEDYLQENIWNKAGMQHTGVEHFGVEYANKSALFYRNKKGKIKLARPNNLSNRIPGGGLYATVEDLLKFGQALMDGTLLSAESLALLQQAPEVERGQNNPYGMGVFLYGDNPLFGPVIGHSGEQTGAAGQLMIMPREQVVVVVLTNTAHAWRDAFGLSVELFPLAGQIIERN